MSLNIKQGRALFSQRLQIVLRVLYQALITLWLLRGDIMLLAAIGAQIKHQRLLQAFRLPAVILRKDQLIIAFAPRLHFAFVKIGHKGTWAGLTL